MGLSSNILGGIMKMGYKVPTPIQRKALPVALSGRDVVAMARTGAWAHRPGCSAGSRRLCTMSWGVRAWMCRPVRVGWYNRRKGERGPVATG
jgi:hypothetical protein